MATKSTIPRVWAGKRYKPPAIGNRIGPGKAGTGQRLIYRTGGGSHLLGVWRSLSQQKRNQMRKQVIKNKGNLSRRVNKIAKARKAKGLTAGGGRPPRPTNPQAITQPRARRAPSRLRRF